MQRFHEFKQVNEARQNTSARQDLDDFFLNYFDTSKAKSQLKQVGYRSPKSKIWNLISYRTTDIDLKKSLAVYEYKVNIKDYLSAEKIQTIIKKMGTVLDIQILSYNLNQTLDSESSDKNVTIVRIYFNYLEQVLQKLTKTSENIVSKISNSRNGFGFSNNGFKNISKFVYPKHYKIEGGYFYFRKPIERDSYEKEGEKKFKLGLLTREKSAKFFDLYDGIMDFAVTNFSNPTNIVIEYGYGEQKVTYNVLKFEQLQEYLSLQPKWLQELTPLKIRVFFKDFIFFISVFPYEIEFIILYKPEFETEKITTRKQIDKAYSRL